MQPQESIERFGYRQELRRGIGLADLVFYGLIFMVPIAPFAIFGSVYFTSGGMPVLTYLVGMVALLFTAASYAQMVRAFPLSGSVYNYAGRGVSAPVGFMTGWAILLDYVLAPCLLYLVASIAMHSTVPQIPVWLWLLAFVAVNTVINLRGIRMTMTLTKVMIAAELAVLALFLVIGVWALLEGRGREFSFAPLFNPETFSWPVVFGAVSIAVLSFLGFDGISMLVEESTGGSAQVGRAMRLALILAGVLFVAQVWVAALLVPNPDALLQQPRTPPSTTRRPSRAARRSRASPRRRPRSPGDWPTPWSPRSPSPACSTRWRVTGSSRPSSPGSRSGTRCRPTPSCSSPGSPSGSGYGCPPGRTASACSAV
ncbi:amino acid transporter [Streptosporangium saharense]|uniref:Amino acid transporter n=1 Tax=Streptosporangium saharense TaxID=1706840 RepID=A0A7W7VRJ6_9ACTN|nr:amino acid transporter [Streptosporangium saharense]